MLRAQKIYFTILFFNLFFDFHALIEPQDVTKYSRYDMRKLINDMIDKHEMDSYFDNIIQDSKPNIKKSMEIPDDIGDSISYWNLKVSGLENLNRTKNITINNMDKELRIRTPVEVHELAISGRASYTGRVNLGITTIRKTWESDFEANLNHIKMLINLYLNLVNRTIDKIDFVYEVFSEANIKTSLDLSWFSKLFFPNADEHVQEFFNEHLPPKIKQSIEESMKNEFNKFNIFEWMQKNVSQIV